MENTNRLIKHELLNILMGIQVILSDGPLTPAKRKEALEVVGRAALLIAYQDIILGAKRKLFLQTIDLKSLLEIIILTHEDKIMEKSVAITLPKGDLSVKADESLVKLALEQIIKAMLGSVSAIEFKWIPQKKTLSIKIKKGAIPELKKKDWLECLKSESPDELGLQLAIRALELQRIKWKVMEKQLEIAF